MVIGAQQSRPPLVSTRSPHQSVIILFSYWVQRPQSKSLASMLHQSRGALLRPEAFRIFDGLWCGGSSLFTTSAASSSQAVHAVAYAQQSPATTYCHVGSSHQPSLPIRGLLVDAAGTLLSPSEKAAAVYRRYGLPFGVQLSEAEILHRFRM